MKYTEYGPVKGFTANSALVENYEKAKADNFKGWCIHHRLETHDENGNLRDKPVLSKELIAKGLYYNRPASELIWLTKSDHQLLHKLVGGGHSYEVKRYKDLVRLHEEGAFELCVDKAQDRVNRLTLNPIQLRNARMKQLDESTNKLVELRLLLDAHPESSILSKLYKREMERNKILTRWLSE